MLALMLLVSLNDPRVAYQHAEVDVVELNHVLDDANDVRFSQIIIWRWMVTFPVSRHVVSEWMIVDPVNVLVVRDVGNRHRVTWRGKGGICYDATAYSYRETVGWNDPEMDDREKYPVDRRLPYFEVVK